MTKEEAIKILEEGEVSRESGFFEAYQMAIESLKQPEVIRCKDCKYWGGTMHFAYGNYNECTRFKAQLTKPEDYCSYAERSTE